MDVAFQAARGSGREGERGCPDTASFVALRITVRIACAIVVVRFLFSFLFFCLLATFSFAIQSERRLKGGSLHKVPHKVGAARDRQHLDLVIPLILSIV